MRLHNERLKSIQCEPTPLGVLETKKSYKDLRKFMKEKRRSVQYQHTQKVTEIQHGNKLLLNKLVEISEGR